jgi:tRNA 2-selenouridine synthase
VQDWHEKIERGALREVVTELLTAHYDPGYDHSTRQNFVQFESAPIITPASHSRADMLVLAQQLVAH